MDPCRHLPADLLPVILSRLPVKSLLRFRCVSKPWLALVDEDADFPQLHLKTFKNNSNETRLFFVKALGRGKNGCEVLCSDKFEPIPNLLPPSETLNPGDWVATFSIDGLFLLQSPSTTNGQFGNIKVWNPSIGKSLEIPPLREQDLLSPCTIMHDTNIGLGYDPVSKYYKLVKLIFANSLLHSVAVYDLVAGSSRWRILGSQTFDWHWNVHEIEKAVYFEDSLCFVAMDVLDRGLDLVGFDLSKEEFFSNRALDGPSVRSSGFQWWKLVSVDVDLIVQGRSWNHSISLYVWTEDAEHWDGPKLYSLKGRHADQIKKNGDILTWRVHGEKVLDENGEVKRVIWNELGSYNREREELKILRLIRSKSLESFYVESLILHRRSLLNYDISNLKISD